MIYFWKINKTLDAQKFWYVPILYGAAILLACL
jgi:hypothetical protein